MWYSSNEGVSNLEHKPNTLSYTPRIDLAVDGYIRSESGAYLCDGQVKMNADDQKFCPSQQNWN